MTVRTIPERLRVHQQHSLALGAFLIACCYPLDLVQPNFGAVAVWRACWVAAVAFAAWGQKEGRPRLAVGVGYAAAVVTGAAVVGIITLSGGTRSIYDGMFIATPFAVLIALPELPLAAATVGGICLAGGAWLRWEEGQPLLTVAAWSGLLLVMSTLAVYGTVALRRLFFLELEVARSRARAVEALVESERRRALAERDAEAARVIASVAHDVNSPLAALRSNLRWAAAGEAPEGERAEALADAIDGADRIAGIISALGRSIQPVSRGAAAPGLAPAAAPVRAADVTPGAGAERETGS